MSTIALNEESVAAYLELLTNPDKHGLPIRPLKEMFKDCEVATASHILFKQADGDYRGNCPKIFFYMVLEKVYGHLIHKDKNGDFGYKLEYVSA